MRIILEGADGSGKTTLAKILSEVTGLPIKHSGGPAKNIREINERTKNFNELDNIIFDRYPIISHRIYGSFKEDFIPVNQGLQNDFYNKDDQVIIYCSKGSLEDEQVSEYGDKDHHETKKDNFKSILYLYRVWGLDTADIIYNKKNLNKVIKLFKEKSFHNDVRDFYTKLEIGYEGSPRHLPPDLQIFRNQLLNEEISEYYKAEDLEDKIDALVDLAYVCVGTCLLNGVNFDRVWDEVHKSNMTKEKATIKNTKRNNPKYDAGKSSNYVPPDIKQFIQGIK